jgi:hypothetical protein
MRHLVARLIQVCVVVGLLATFSYASGLHNVVRMRAPAAGAWWNAHEFYLMEGAATALGLLVALRVGVRFAAEAASLCYLAPVTLALEAALLMPLTRLCARVARIGADDGAIVAANRMAAYAGFESGKMLDIAFDRGAVLSQDHELRVPARSGAVWSRAGRSDRDRAQR